MQQQNNPESAGEASASQQKGESPTLRVIDIVPGTSVDGPGLRTSIYFAGCDHRCPGCHNPQSWPFDAGRDMTIDEICDEIDRSGFNVTFSGGDPLDQMPTLTLLAAELRRRGYTIWCYTGFLWEDVCRSEQMSAILPYLEVLVDGPFVESLRDLSLLFRGSSNQRLIAVGPSLALTEPEPWHSDF